MKSLFSSTRCQGLGTAVLLSLLIAAGCRTTPGPHVPKPMVAATNGPGLQVQSLQMAWETIRDTYYDPHFHGLDWEAIGKEYSAKAASARSAAEVRPVIEAMLATLGHSHLGVIPQEASPLTDDEELPVTPFEPPASVAENLTSKPIRSTRPIPSVRPKRRVHREAGCGLEFRWSEQDGMLVIRVDEGSPAEKLGITPGWRLLNVEGTSVDDIIRAYKRDEGSARRSFLILMLLQQHLDGPLDSKADLVFEDAKGHHKKLKVPRILEKGEPVRLGALPVLFTEYADQTLKTPSDREVGYVRFNYWMMPVAQKFHRSVDKHRKDLGMIIDMRGNFGGIGGLVMGVAGHFVTERAALGTMGMRGNDLIFAALPRTTTADGDSAEPFAGKVAILTDDMSISAAELFAGGMQAIGRARIFGSRSAGQALPASFKRLPNGDLLYYAFANFVLPDGTRLEVKGVQPDVYAPWRRESLLKGHDAALDAALNWIDEPK